MIISKSWYVYVANEYGTLVISAIYAYHSAFDMWIPQYSAGAMCMHDNDRMRELREAHICCKLAAATHVW